ncbi:MAG TPA: M61 family peptidase [Rhodanobacteraceae bacterium]|nr:M61 family peptidase [Rhodanobacteraceae bacterium]
MKTTLLATLVTAALGFGSAALAANVASPQPIDYPGTLSIRVDATDLTHRIFRVHETIPATPGPMVLLYPEWLPGKHSPTGPIDKFAGLKLSANGQPLSWKRDSLNVYAFHVEVPAGVSQIDAEFQYLSPQDRRQGRVVMTPEMLNLQWDAMSLYPAGYNADRIAAVASVTLPAGWQFGTALEVASKSGDTVTFKPIDYANLVDSPMFAGKYFKRVELTKPGDKQPVYMDFVADEAKNLEMTDEQIQLHKNIVVQMDKLYGARHFNHYDFLAALSDKMSGIGLEHHRSSENGVSADYFNNWDKNWGRRSLFTHEFNHSWNGKYRRGADLTTPNFNVPMGDSLLWVYEGQTQFWGNVIAARAGLHTKEQSLEMLAMVAATYDKNRPGLAWRSIQDTTNDPVIAQRAPLPYRNYQMSEDYYSGGAMIWLAVNAKLQSLSRNKRSLDDFAKAFFGMNNGDWSVNTYTFEDVVKTLNTIVPFDWASFLRQRLNGHGNLIDGIAASGWKLVYTNEPSKALKAYEAARHVADFTYSLGFSVGSKGDLSDVRWDSPAFNAGLAPSMTIVAVNGHEFSGDALKDAVKAAAGKDNTTPIELLVKNFDQYRTIRIDYHDGLKYPHLEKVKGKTDLLSTLLEAR